MVGVEEEVRKGPWSEQEDMQLVCYVRLLGERRWDFVAKVSGLNRTGKSCRLRWVNYLHPGLKRGRMTPHEERLVLQLHSIWGNSFDIRDDDIEQQPRWSRIARKLPGRTDNEIKNYWRTHMRRKAQERKTSSSPLSSSSSSSYHCSPSVSEHPLEDGVEENEISNDGRCSYFKENEEGVKGYPIDNIWKEIATMETMNAMSFEEHKEDPMSSATWEYCSDSLWKIDDENLFTIIG